MRAIMIVGLLIVLLIVGILTMQNMGAGSGDADTETQARGYIDRAEEAADSVEDRMQGLRDRLDLSD